MAKSSTFVWKAIFSFFIVAASSFISSTTISYFTGMTWGVMPLTENLPVGYIIPQAYISSASSRRNHNFPTQIRLRVFLLGFSSFEKKREKPNGRKTEKRHHKIGLRAQRIGVWGSWGSKGISNDTNLFAHSFTLWLCLSKYWSDIGSLGFYIFSNLLYGLLFRHNPASGCNYSKQATPWVWLRPNGLTDRLTFSVSDMQVLFVTCRYLLEFPPSYDTKPSRAL